MSYPAEYLDEDLGGLLGAPQAPRRSSGFAALGELLGGGIDRQGAYLKGQLTSARTQEAIQRARLAQSQAGVGGLEYDALSRLATERPNPYDTAANPIDFILGKRGSDLAAATEAHLRNQQFDNRAVLGNPLATPDARQAAGDAVQGDFKAFEPVGAGYYSTTDIAGGVKATPRAPGSPTVANGKPSAGYRFVNGGASEEPIPGGPADPKVIAARKANAPPSEGERKDAALATRLQNSLLELAAINDREPDALTPGLGETMAAKVAGDIGRGYVQTPNRRQAYGAQLDALDAILTLSTGAAYTREQLQGLATGYLPSVTDDDATKAAKQRRLNVQVGLAIERSGRAAPSILKALERAGPILGLTAPPTSAAPAPAPGTELPPTNAQGWVLHTDAQGNQAYVNPDGSGQYEEVQ